MRSRDTGSRLRRLLGWLLAPALMLGPTGGVTAAPAAEPGGAPALTVFAAASLTDAMKHIAQLWQAQGHAAPRLSFASSSVLAQQVGQGAPADVFISADLKWMDWLAGRHLIQPDTRANLLGNSLVLVEPRAGLKPVTIGPDLDLAGILGAGGRLAIGDPASVPAGIYAKQALTRLQLWDAVSQHLAPAENVRAALLLVERGEVPAGIVYGSDVASAPGLAVAGTFPDSSHDLILYPDAVPTTATDQDEARRFLAFLRTPAAVQAFRAAGFTVLDTH